VSDTARERAEQLENWIQQAQVTLDWHRRTGEPTEGADLVAFELAQAVLALRERAAALEEALRQITKLPRQHTRGNLQFADDSAFLIARAALAGVPVSRGGA
jgi:hypothetical protein